MEQINLVRRGGWTEVVSEANGHILTTKKYLLYYTRITIAARGRREL